MIVWGAKRFLAVWPIVIEPLLLIPNASQMELLQLIVQLKSFNLSQKVALRVIEAENCGQITKKLWEKNDFYEQNHIFF